MPGAMQGNRQAYRRVLRLGLVALLCVLTLDAAAAQGAHRPDLVVKQVSVTAGPFAPGDGFDATNKVKNVGNRRAPASTTGYFLSTDTTKDTNDAAAGTVGVPKLKPGRSASSSPDLAVPVKGVADGDYHLIACADEPEDIREKREGNNCRSSDTQIEVASGPAAPEVLGATATSQTSVVVTFDAQLAPASVSVSGFSIPGLTVSSASANNKQVTLTTASQSPGASYTVTVADSVKDTNGTGVDPAHNSASFNGFTPAAPQVLGATATSQTSVVVTFDAQLDPASVSVSGFSIPGLTVSSASANNKQVILTTSSQSPGASYTVTVADSVKDTNGTGVDPAHNSASFSGFTPAAHLLLNEVAPNITGGADLVELRAATGGPVAGMTLQQDVASPAILATLPAATVASGDLIVVHLIPPGGVTSETASKTECGDAACFSGAWDVVGGTTGVTFGDRVLTVNAASSNLNDAVPFVRPTAADRAAFPPEVQTLRDAGEWLGACGSPCGYASTPSVLDISVDWESASSTTGANSVARTSNSDTNQKSDWAVGASSFGALNAGKS